MEHIDTKTIFRERFEKLRKGRSNTEFADFLGMSRQTVGFWLNGNRMPDACSLAKIAETCGVSSDYLLGLSEFETRDIELAKFQDRFGLNDRACSDLENIADFSAEIKEDGDPLTLSDFVNEIIAAGAMTAYDFCQAISNYLKCNLADVTSHHYHVVEDNENVIISVHEYALLSKEKVKSFFNSFIDQFWNRMCDKCGVQPDLTYNYEKHHRMLKKRVQEWEREHAEKLKECDGVYHGET